METVGFWKDFITQEAQKSYFHDLFDFLEQAYTTRKVCPDVEDLFLPFELTPWETLKVIILGQEPYYGPNHADGLAFSAAHSKNIPGTLRNIKKELYSDVDVEITENGDLSDWARQGVFLLNTVLTVESGKPGSHRGRGWETFTDEAIRACSAINDRSLVFVLWGAGAQAKAHLIDGKRHFVMKSSSPSPLTAHNGFFKSEPFSKINKYLQVQGKTPIKWGHVL